MSVASRSLANRSARSASSAGQVAGTNVREVGSSFDSPLPESAPPCGIDDVHRFDQPRLERGRAPALPTVGERLRQRLRRVARRLEGDERAEHLAVEVVGDAIGRGAQAAAHPLARRDGDLAHPVELEQRERHQEHGHRRGGDDERRRSQP